MARRVVGLAILCVWMPSAAHAASDAKPPLVEGPPLQPPQLSAPLWTPQRPANATRTLKFKSLPDRIGKASIQLSNGEEVIDLTDWRAVAVSDSDGGEMCTLSLIGPRAVLLAAHCVDAGQPALAPEPNAVAASVEFKGKPYTLKCRLPAAYLQWEPDAWGAPRSSADYALCEVNKPVKDVPFDTIADGLDFSAGAGIRLMGFGCIELGISGAGTYIYRDGKVDGRAILRMGNDTIERTGVTLHPERPAYYWRLASGGKDPVLCPGDSGGPVTVGAAEKRRIVAVNSGLGAIPGVSAAHPAFYSYLSPLNTQAFHTFLKDWIEAGEGDKGKVKRIVCGVTRPAGIQGCRG